MRLVASPRSQTIKKIMLRPSALWALKLANSCGIYSSTIRIPSKKNAAAMGHTKTHIQATRLILPKTPDNAKVTGGGCDATDMAAWTTNEAMSTTGRYG